MSVVDVHPEDLIDREARGSLSVEERAHLEAHLARCAACRLERKVRADFAAELAPRRGGAGMHELVYGALQVAQDTRAAAGSDMQPAPAPKPRRFRAVALLVAIPALLVSGLAFAQSELATRMVELARETLGISVSSAPAERPVKPTRRAAPATSLAPAPAADRVSALATVPAPAPLPLAERASSGASASAGSSGSSRGGASAHSRRHRVHAISRTPVPVSATPTITASPAHAPEPAPAPLPAVTAQSLFGRANAARRAGRMLEASALYRELNTRFAASAEARIAIVLLARLQLDGGETEAALAGFEAYLDSGHGALREQAMVGRAQALRRLGRSTEERAAVRELLRAYPDSPYAQLARERLELSEP